MSILITGGLGYVGSHVVKELTARGEHVVNLDNLLFGHREAGVGVEFVIGDIGDENLLEELFSRYNFDAVMHFAALADVGESVLEPAKYYFVNVVQSLVLLKVMIRHNVMKMIFSSSAATFGEPTIVPIPEDHPKEPTNPYGRSKLMLEQILSEYDTAYGVKSISLRYFNASGAHESGEIGEDHTPEHHLIPAVLQVAMGQKEKISVFGNDWPTKDGTCIRDYVHVSDLAQAHILALDALRDGHLTTVYNMGNGAGYSVLEVVDISRKVSGCHIPVEFVRRRLGDPAVLVASSDKIARELGWKPNYAELETIIKTAWNWHSSHPRGYSG